MSTSLPVHQIRIGISGKIGSGKDTIALMIREAYKHLMIAPIALKVKEVVSLMTSTPMDVYNSREGKSYIPPGFDKTIGRMLQIVGENMRILICEDVWVNSLFDNPEIKERGTITPDVRYKNEVKKILSYNGLLIRVNGDPKRIREENKDKRDLKHSSEVDLDDYKFENVIENNGTLEELKEKVMVIVNKYLEAQCQV